MASSENQAIIDKNHGFMKFIIRNQYDRDRYDKEQKQKLNVNRDSTSSSKKTLINNFKNVDDDDENNKKPDYPVSSSSENLYPEEKRVKNSNRIDFSSLKLDSKEKIDFERLEINNSSSVSEENIFCYKNNENTKQRSKEFLLDCVPTKLGQYKFFCFR